MVEFFMPMKFKIFYLFVLGCVIHMTSQTKVGGHIIDINNEPVAFANVIFKGSSEGTISNENGRFYLESEERWDTLVISFVGFETLILPLKEKLTLNLKLVLNDTASQLDEVVLFTGKQSKKDNPAISILRKVWENKRDNGLRRFKQYEYDKYEKV
jgi:hypothetical protein